MTLVASDPPPLDGGTVLSEEISVVESAFELSVSGVELTFPDGVVDEPLSGLELAIVVSDPPPLAEDVVSLFPTPFLFKRFCNSSPVTHVPCTQSTFVVTLLAISCCNVTMPFCIATPSFASAA